MKLLSPIRYALSSDPVPRLWLCIIMYLSARRLVTIMPLGWLGPQIAPPIVNKSARLVRCRTRV